MTQLARLLRFAVALTPLALAAAPSVAQAARPRIDRQGGQWGIMLGGSACLPGRSACRQDLDRDGVRIHGHTRPSFGTSAELGYRFNRFIFLGASYHFGLFNPDYDFIAGRPYRHAYQHSIYAMVRPTLPVWRFDFGLGLGPGFSRQVFRIREDQKDYSQGFSWVIAPSIDIFVTRRIFVGFKADFLLNAHRNVCRMRGSDTACRRSNDLDLGPVHQVLFGFRLGGTFL